MKKFLFSLLLVPALVLGGCDLFANATDYHNRVVEINNPISTLSNAVETLVETQTTKAVTDKAFDRAGYDAAAAEVVSKIDAALTQAQALEAFKGDETVKNALVLSLQEKKDLMTKMIPDMIEKVSKSTDEQAMMEVIKEFAESGKHVDESEAKALSALDAFDKEHGVKVR